MIRRALGRRPILQLGILLAVVAVLAVLGATVSSNMARLGLTPGFGFLGQPASFEIGESPIAYRAGDIYARALLAGLVNTVLVSALGCALATVLGALVGLARLSRNLLLAGLAQAFVEIARNTPLLLQLFFWTAAAHALPPPRQALHPMAGVVLTNRGVYLPWLVVESSAGLALILCVIAAIALSLLSAFSERKRRLLLGLAAAAGAAACGLVAFGAPGVAFDLPALRVFNIAGGVSVSPEFAALLIGLTIHASAQVAEIVRAGVQSIPQGQWEASEALGLSRAKTLRLVVMPQALRVIVPLLTSTYLDLVKNSSLAVAIGFPDFVSVANTTANQSGHAIEALTLMIAAYLTLNLAVSALMNRYDSALARRGYARP